MFSDQAVKTYSGGKPNYTQLEPEPVVIDTDGTIRLLKHPPQREWVGLTDDEIMSLLPGAVRLPPGWADTVRAIEAKLNEKNT
jgi:hypothetical protein